MLFLYGLLGPYPRWLFSSHRNMESHESLQGLNFANGLFLWSWNDNSYGLSGQTNLLEWSSIPRIRRFESKRKVHGGVWQQSHAISLLLALPPYRRWSRVFAAVHPAQVMVVVDHSNYSEQISTFKVHGQELAKERWVNFWKHHDHFFPLNSCFALGKA